MSLIQAIASRQVYDVSVIPALSSLVHLVLQILEKPPRLLFALTYRRKATIDLFLSRLGMRWISSTQLHSQILDREVRFTCRSREYAPFEIYDIHCTSQRCRWRSSH